MFCPFDRLRDREFLGPGVLLDPSTGSGTGDFLTLRQAQGPGVFTCPFDRLRDREFLGPGVL